MSRTATKVQDPMEYTFDPEKQPYRERGSETKRQKGFRQAKSIESVISPYLGKKAVRQEIDEFMSWNKPREEV